MLLAIDPGLRGCGCAVFTEGSKALLWGAGYVRNPLEAGDGPGAWLNMASAVFAWSEDINSVVIELPRVYQGAQQKGDPEDLIQLAALTGAISERLASAGGHIATVRPSEWKGQVPKDIMNMRILSKLSVEELAVIKHVGKTKDHNVIDAIGIGMFHLGRLR